MAEAALYTLVCATQAAWQKLYQQFPATGWQALCSQIPNCL
jgi:hypothetical protein